MPFRKKLTLLAFVVTCCFWKSLLAHAGANNSSPSNQSGVTARLGLGLPWGGDIGGVFSRQMTDATWHTQLIEKLWQQARKEFLKAPKNSRYAEYLQTVEQQFRYTLTHRLKQAQPPQDQSGHTHAQFAVTQTLETLKALIGQVQQESEQKALQGVVDFIQLAQDELNAIAQDSNANVQLKDQWQSVVEQAFRDHQAILRDRALIENATKEDYYRYAMHLWTDKDCLKTDNGDIVKEHFFKAARDGHPDAALKLLEIHQYQVVSTDPGDVFFRLSQLQSNGPSLFQPQVRTHFLACAILFKNKPALVHLNSKIREDIDQGVRRKPDDTRWQAWVDLRSDLKKLAKAKQTQAEMGELIQDEMDELIEEVDGMYKEKKKNGKKKLALLSRMDNFSESDSDEEDVDKDQIFKAARDGDPDAALKLLKIHQYQVVSTDPGDVFFQLSQLQINGQSLFQPQVRTHFLARAILFKNKPALVHLNSKIREDIDQGVRRKDTDARWQAWVALGTCLKALATAEQTPAERGALIQDEVDKLIQEVNGMYKEKNGKKRLALLSQIQADHFPESDSGEESGDANQAVVTPQTTCEAQKQKVNVSWWRVKRRPADNNEGL